MLKNGTLIYNVSKRSFLNTQFQSEVLNVVFLAVLTTLLAYQLSAICYNIFLGLKPKGRATASDFHKLILSEASSPLSILAAVTRNDRVDRLRFKRDIPRNVRIARRETSVPIRVAFSLFSLLLVAPLLNLTSIFIVLQGDETLTFGGANFPGVALGVTNDTLTLHPSSTICDRVSLRLEGAPATLRSQLSVCFELEYALVNMDGTIVRLSVESTSQGLVKVSTRTFPKDISASIAVSLDMATEDQLYRTEPMISPDGAARLLHDGQKTLAKYCDSASKAESPHNADLLNITTLNGTFVVSKDFKCKISDARAYADVGFDMLGLLGMVDDVPFRVVNVEDLDPDASSAPKYFDASSLPFITRRSRNASVTLLLIALGVSAIVRMITSLLFNNDVDEGIEAVLRYRLGAEPDQSFLESSRTVRYNMKRQDGATAHYGLQKSELPEVDDFGSGIEIGLEENTWVPRTRREW